MFAHRFLSHQAFVAAGCWRLGAASGNKLSKIGYADVIHPRIWNRKAFEWMFGDANCSGKISRVDKNQLAESIVVATQ